MEHPLFYAWKLFTVPRDGVPSRRATLKISTVEGFWRSFVPVVQDLLHDPNSAPVRFSRTDLVSGLPLESPWLRQEWAFFDKTTCPQKLVLWLLLALEAIGHQRVWSANVVLEISYSNLIFYVPHRGAVHWARINIGRKRQCRSSSLCAEAPVDPMMPTGAGLKKKKKKKRTETVEKPLKIPLPLAQTPIFSMLLAEIVDRIQVSLHIARVLYTPYQFPAYRIERVKGRQPFIDMVSEVETSDRGLVIETLSGPARKSNLDASIGTVASPVISRRAIPAADSTAHKSFFKVDHFEHVGQQREWAVSPKNQPAFAPAQMNERVSMARAPWVYWMSLGTSQALSLMLMEHLTYLAERNIPILVSAGRKRLQVEGASGEIVEEVGVRIAHWKLIQTRIQHKKRPVVRDAKTGKVINNKMPESESGVHYFVAVASEKYDYELLIDLASGNFERGTIIEWTHYEMNKTIHWAMPDIPEVARKTKEEIDRCVPPGMQPFLTAHNCQFVEKMSLADKAFYDVTAWQGKWEKDVALKMARTSTGNTIILAVDSRPADHFETAIPPEFANAIPTARDFFTAILLARTIGIRISLGLVSLAHQNLNDPLKGTPV